MFPANSSLNSNHTSDVSDSNLAYTWLAAPTSATARWRLGTWLAVSFALALLALLGLYAFTLGENEFELLPHVASGGAYAGNYLLGLLVFFHAGPLALLVLFMGLQSAMGTAVRSRWQTASLLICISGASLVAGTGLGYFYFDGKASLRCGWAWCWADNAAQFVTWPKSEVLLAWERSTVNQTGESPQNITPTVTEWAEGDSVRVMTTVFGIWIFLASAAVAAACLSILLSNLSSPAKPGASQRNELDNVRRRIICQQRVQAGCLLLAVPVMILVSGVLPIRLVEFLYHGDTYKKYIVTPQHPERLTAWMVTCNLRMWGYVVKVYPDIVLFYGLLGAFLVSASLCREVSLARQVRDRLLVKGFRVGDAASLLLLGIFYGLFTYYWYHEKIPHGYDGNKIRGLDETFPHEARVARTVGMVATATLGLLLIPASKNSLLLQAAGISWESSLWVHILLGTLMLMLALTHVVLFAVRYVTGPQNPIPPGVFKGWFGSEIRKGTLWDLLPFRFWWHACGGDWITPLMTTVFWGALACFAVLPWFRRKHYNMFRLAHYYFLVFIPVTALHCACGWVLLLPGCLMWLADAFLHLRQAARRVDVVVAEVHPGGVIEVEFHWSGKAKTHSPLMFCMVNFPEVSITQWHPFTLSASPLDNYESLHIQVMGPGSWTSRLHTLVDGVTDPSQLTMRVEGPYGSLRNFTKPHLLLVAGGIGVTPMQNVLRFLQRSPETVASVQSVHLVWTSRTASLFDVFQHSLTDGALPQHPRVDISLYCSQAIEEPSRACACALGPIHAGRVDLSALLKRELEEHGPTLVCVCGPSQLVQGLRTAVGGLPLPLASVCDVEEWSFEF